MSLLLAPPANAATTSAADATASSESAVIRHVAVGFDGKYKLGYWIPVRVTLEATEPTSGWLEVIVLDSDGVPTLVASDPDRPIEIAAGAAATETLYVKPGQLEGPVVVRFTQDQRVLSERTYYPDARGGKDIILPGLPATARLLVVVGGDIGLEAALRVAVEDPAIATHVATVRKVGELPDEPLGWDGVDGVVLLTSSPEIYIDLQFAASRTALTRWLELGGRLFVFVGHSADLLLGGENPLAPLTPGDFVGQEPLRQASAIEALCDSQYSIGVPAGTFQIPVAYLSPVRGKVAAFGANLPLIVHAVRGFGRLTWIGFDVDRPPLADWTGRPELLRRLIGVTHETQNNVASDAGKLTSLGYTDLVGQLRAALDQFAGVRTVSFGWAIGLTLVYLVLLGPVDYWLVHRWGRRPVLTWLTLPIFALAIGGGAYGLARATKGHDVRLNQVELIDFDAATSLVRSNVWAHLYTPRHERFTLSLHAELPFALESEVGGLQPVLSWLTLPGRGLGGVEATADVLSIERGYRYAAHHSVLEGLPLPIWTSKSLHGTWHAHSQLPIQAELVAGAAGNNPLSGRVTSDLDRPLHNVRLYFERWVYRLGTVEPGEAIDLDRAAYLSSVGDLTRRTFSREAPPYDPALRDARRVLEIMNWYELAGGPSYVGLLNRYHANLDFGHLLDPGRAVLVAESPTPGSHIVNNGQTIEDEKGLKLVVYRFVLPVAAAAE